MSVSFLSGLSWSDAPGIIFGVLGASFFLSAYLPEFFHTYKTKNTVGINRNMFFLHLIVGILFWFGAVFLIAEGAVDSTGGTGKWINGTIFATLNLTTSCCCLYTFLLKLRNSKEAESMGISESEHYERVCKSYAGSKIAKAGIKEEAAAS